MTSKTILLLLLALSVGSSHAAAVATAITTPNGTITGTNITWTTTLNNGITIGTNGLEGNTGNVGTNGGGADMITIIFSRPVDLTVAPHSTITAANFSNIPISNTLVADNGTWTFTPSTSPNPTPPSGFPMISGSTLQTTLATWSGAPLFSGASPQPLANSDWGSFHIGGITQISWTLEDGAFREAFNFIVIPEPSRVILIAFGLLSLALRRRR